MRMRTHQRFEREAAEGAGLLTKWQSHFRQQPKTRLTPPSKTIPSDAPFKKAREYASFFVSDEDENPSKVRARGGRGAEY